VADGCVLSSGKRAAIAIDSIQEYRLVLVIPVVGHALWVLLAVAGGVLLFHYFMLAIVAYEGAGKEVWSSPKVCPQWLRAIGYWGFFAAGLMNIGARYWFKESGELLLPIASAIFSIILLRWSTPGGCERLAYYFCCLLRVLRFPDDGFRAAREIVGITAS